MNADNKNSGADITAMKRLHRRLGICLGIQVTAVLIFQAAWLVATRLPNTLYWNFWFLRASEFWVLMVPVIILAAFASAWQFTDSPLIPGFVSVYGVSITPLFLSTWLIFDVYNNDLFVFVFYLLCLYSIVPEIFLRRWLKNVIERANDPSP